MAIRCEYQLVAECDKCNNYEISGIHRRAEFIKILRQNGWSIGKNTLCNRCAEEKNLRKLPTKHDVTCMNHHPSCICLKCRHDNSRCCLSSRSIEFKCPITYCTGFKEDYHDENP
jgi:hypothetical protein